MQNYNIYFLTSRYCTCDAKRNRKWSQISSKVILTRLSPLQKGEAWDFTRTIEPSPPSILLLFPKFPNIIGLAAFMRGRELSTLVVITLAAAGE